MRVNRIGYFLSRIKLLLPRKLLSLYRLYKKSAMHFEIIEKIQIGYKNQTHTLHIKKKNSSFPYIFNLYVYYVSHIYMCIYSKYMTIILGCQ